MFTPTTTPIRYSATLGNSSDNNTQVTSLIAEEKKKLASWRFSFAKLKNIYLCSLYLHKGFFPFLYLLNICSMRLWCTGYIFKFPFALVLFTLIKQFYIHINKAYFSYMWEAAVFPHTFWPMTKTIAWIIRSKNEKS